MSLLRDKFISFLQLKGFTKATVRNYIQSIKQFQDWLGKSPVHVTRESAHRYLDYLKNDKKLAPRTMNIHIYALKRFCDFFLPQSDVMSPFSRMRTPKY
jgi:site-specific recombinase XerD